MTWKHPRTENRYIPRPHEPLYVDIIGEGFYDLCKVKDISNNGIGIFVRHDFSGCEIDHEIELCIKMPNKQSFKAVGKIRHMGVSTSHYFGILFLFVDEKGKKLLKEYLQTFED